MYRSFLCFRELLCFRNVTYARGFAWRCSFALVGVFFWGGSYRCFYRFVFECFYRCLLGVRELFFFGVSASIGAFVASESSSSLWWSVSASIGVFVVCEVVSESSACESFFECFYRGFRELCFLIYCLSASIGTSESSSCLVSLSASIGISEYPRALLSWLC